MVAALRIKGLCKEYLLANESVHALVDVDLEVPKGDYVAIMGPSGSGKSTLLNLLGCLDKPTSGDYFIGDVNVALLDDDHLSQIRADRIGFVFQAYNLVSQLTVLENIEAPLAYGEGLSSADEERCHQLAELVGLGDRLNHRPSQLSGGQQQRAAIARSLINQPHFILADEPTGNLDTSTTSDILDVFDRLNEAGTTIVMVTHEADVAKRARRIVRLRDGTVESDDRLDDASELVESREPTDPLHPNSYNNDGAQFANRRRSKLQLRLRDLRIGLKSVLMHPLRSLLTILGIFIGVASVIWLLAIGEGISAKAQQQIAELGANNIIIETTRPPNEQTGNRRIYTYGLTDRDRDVMEQTIRSIEFAIPFCRRQGYEFRHRDRMTRGEIIACTPRFRQLYSLELHRGRFLTDNDDEAKSMVCILAQEVADELFLHRDPLGQSIRIHRDFYRVVGIFASRSRMEGIRGSVRSQDFADNAYIPLSTFWSRFGDSSSRGSDGGMGITQITLRLKDKKDAFTTSEVLLDTLTRSHKYDDYTITVPLELLARARSTRLMFMAMMALIAAISLIVGGIGIMNIMLATVTERTREIGIRRALGANRGDITRQFVFETVMLSVAGGLTGILGGFTCGVVVDGLRHSLNYLVPEMMATLPESVQTVNPIILPWSIPLAFGISVLVGVVFGLYPARRAAAMHPIEALRHVG